MNWRNGAELALKGRQRKTKARRIAARRGSKEARRYCFVIPSTTWSKGLVDPALALICPSSELQLDPRTHPDIIRLLCDEETPGFLSDFITFDENNALARVTEDGNQYFGSIRNPEREFSEPRLARAYLDLINLAIDNQECDQDKEDELVATLLMPDVRAQATPLRNLYSSAPLPSDVPGLRLPPVLHPILPHIRSSSEGSGIDASLR